MTPVGITLYLLLIITSLVMCRRVPKWDREVIYLDAEGHARYGFKLHYIVGLTSLAMVLVGHMLFSHSDAYVQWLSDSKTETTNAGLFLFVTVGGFLLKPSQPIGNRTLKPSQTRLVRLACGMASGIGLGMLIIRYLPFV